MNGKALFRVFLFLGLSLSSASAETISLEIQNLSQADVNITAMGFGYDSTTIRDLQPGTHLTSSGGVPVASIFEFSTPFIILKGTSHTFDSVHPGIAVNLNVGGSGFHAVDFQSLPAPGSHWKLIVYGAAGTAKTVWYQTYPPSSSLVRDVLTGDDSGMIPGFGDVTAQNLGLHAATRITSGFFMAAGLWVAMLGITASFKGFRAVADAA